MLEEMEAYARQALKIDSLEREIKELKQKLEFDSTRYILKEQVKSWFSSIDGNYAFLTNEGKLSIFNELGEK